MSKEFHIRPFAADDLSRLQEIRQAAFAPVFRSFREIVGEKIADVALEGAEREQAELLDKICEDESRQDVIIIEQDGKIVGFCGVKLDHDTGVGEIDLNAVHPDAQGNGLGTALYDAALDQMRKAGMKVASVGTGGDPSHAPARRAYEKAGFGPAIPSVWMYRAL